MPELGVTQKLPRSRHMCGQREPPSTLSVDAEKSPNERELGGATATLDEAEAALRASWEEWLAWAGLSDAKE